MYGDISGMITRRQEAMLKPAYQLDLANESESEHNDDDSIYDSSDASPKRPNKIPRRGRLNSTSPKRKGKALPEPELEPMSVQRMKDELEERIIGQSYAINTVVPTLAFIYNRIRVPIETTQRVYPIMFTGPTGTGKTELSNKIKRLFLCDTGQSLSFLAIKEDMGGVHDASHYNKFIGVGQGYAGYGDSNLVSQLNAGVERYKQLYEKEPPYLFLLLDEIDKCAKGVFNIFNSLFDKGELSGGSSKFVLPQKTFFIILATANYGSSTNDPDLPATSIQHVKDEMFRDKLDKCDIGRIRLFVPFFELTQDHRKKIAILIIKKIMKEYSALNNLSPNFSGKFASYIMRRSQKDARSLEKELIDTIDNIMTAHKCNSPQKNTFKISFEDANNRPKILDVGDFSELNHARVKEYKAYFEKYAPNHDIDATDDVNDDNNNNNNDNDEGDQQTSSAPITINNVIPCITLYYKHEMQQCHILSFNQFATDTNTTTTTTSTQPSMINQDHNNNKKKRRRDQYESEDDEIDYTITKEKDLSKKEEDLKKREDALTNQRYDFMILRDDTTKDLNELNEKTNALLQELMSSFQKVNKQIDEKIMQICSSNKGSI